MCDRPGSLMDSKLSQTTIGVLYPGELGSTFAKLLVESGFRVVTTLEGRSLRTRKLCHDAGLNVLDSVGKGRVTTVTVRRCELYFAFDCGQDFRLAESAAR